MRPAQRGVPPERELLSLVRRLALAFALTVAVALPAIVFYLNYSKLTEHVKTMAQVKADSLAPLASGDPQMWKYSYVRLDEMLRRSPFELGSERITVSDLGGDSFLILGEAPDAPTLTFSSPVYDYGRVVGRLEVTHSYRSIVFGALLAALVGLLLGIMVYVASTLPLRALRGMAEALLHESAALRAAEKQFRSLIEQSLTGVYIHQGGVLVYANPRLEQILGYAPGELRGLHIDDIVIAQDLPILQAIGNDLRARTTSVSYEARARRKDGSIVKLGVQGSSSEFNGEPAIVGMAQDITEKKRAEEQIQLYLKQLETAFMSTVQVATTLGELRDPYTAGHQRRVAEIAVAIGAELGFDTRRLDGLRVAGYLHDIGKISIPAEILSKPGTLNAIEYQLIQGHSQAGYEVLKDVEFPWPVAQIALQHHERMDGSGYPQGLKGEAISLEARVLAVADVVEAMSTHRPYRVGLGIEAALAEIERGQGKLYDAAVGDACLRLFREKSYTIAA